MTRKQILKFGSLFLALLLSIGTVTACNGDTGKDLPGDTDDGSGDEVVAEGADALVEQLYGDKSYDGAEFRILAIESGEHWYSSISDTANEVWFEESGSEVLQRSIYERNNKTQKLLDVEIVPIWGGNSDGVAGRVAQAVLAAQNDFDIAFAGLRSLMTNASDNYLLNLNDFEDFDEDHSWWNQLFIDNITLFGTDLYVASGAINIWDDCSNNALIFNKDYLEYYSCEDPYQQVFDGTWTIENQSATMKKATQDVNGDGEMDDTDNWGAGGIGILLYNGMFGLDTRITELNADGIPELVCMTEEHLTKVEAFFDVVMNSEAFYEQGIPGPKEYLLMFQEGQMGMAYSNLTNLFQLRNMEDEYGLLPLAKYNEEQENYTGHCDSYIYTCYGIPKSCQDPYMAVVCLEVMGGYSVDTLDKSLHEILFESKLTRDEESKEVLKILQSIISFDWAYVGQWRENLVGMYDLKSGWPFTLASNLEADYESATERLNELVGKFEEISSSN